MDLGVIILAAGQGSRMRSSLPKVLHALAGAPLLGHVLDSVSHLHPSTTVVVYGYGGDRVLEAFPDAPVRWARQTAQLGTGHAVQQALPLARDVERVLILYGDVPLIEAKTLHRLLAESEDSPMGLLTVNLADPTGYGRILRDPQGRVLRVVEQKDATEPELEIDEVNTGIMVIDRQRLDNWLARLDNRNAQGEYYLTDVIGMAVSEGLDIPVTQPDHVEEVLGVNDRVQLAYLERYFQARRAEELMRAGVTLADPARFDLRGTLHTGRDVTIDVNVLIEGEVHLGDGVSIGPNCVLRRCRIAAGTHVLANSIIDHAAIGSDAQVGPFARIRPETELADGVHVGNFVELKKSQIGKGSKVNHLTYIGDATIGSGTNVGAGTITCNYDGANKHRTEIGNDTFIGSNAALVAPVRIGDGATIGAGSVITADAPAGQLTLARARQTTIPGWQRPRKPQAKKP
jgi:bifunctional UDP-N-acetylglucosamine pyrophosphorylase / glucosamine-1-phosphate N-acetyltransferase